MLPRARAFSLSTSKPACSPPHPSSSSFSFFSSFGGGGGSPREKEGGRDPRRPLPTVELLATTRQEKQQQLSFPTKHQHTLLPTGKGRPTIPPGRPPVKLPFFPSLLFLLSKTLVGSAVRKRGRERERCIDTKRGEKKTKEEERRSIPWMGEWPPRSLLLPFSPSLSSYKALLPFASSLSPSADFVNF